MRTRVLADGFTPLRSTKSHTKLTKNIGHHPKKKKIGTSKVFQRLYVFHLYAQRNHSLSLSQYADFLASYHGICCFALRRHPQDHGIVVRP